MREKFVCLFFVCHTPMALFVLHGYPVADPDRGV